MIAIQTKEEIQYESRNPSLLGKVRIEVKSVIRDPETRHYYMHIVDSIIYKYTIQVPVYENQDIQVPVLDDQGQATFIDGVEQFTTQTISVQVGTEPLEKEGVRVHKENKKYPITYEMALQLEQIVMANFPPEPAVQGADLRDYITKFGLYILTTQLEATPTYNVEPQNWEFI